MYLEYSIYHLSDRFNLKEKVKLGWWFTHIIHTLRRLRQRDCHKFEASLGHTVSSIPIWDMY